METQNLVQSSQGQTWATALGCVSGGEKKIKIIKNILATKQELFLFHVILKSLEMTGT